MEPGHEDREDLALDDLTPIQDVAAMEPGHEDREDTSSPGVPSKSSVPQWSPVTKTGKTTTWGQLSF